METAITLYYILCYSINLLNLCLLVYLYAKRHQARHREELLFMSGLMAISLGLSMPQLILGPDSLVQLPLAVGLAIMVVVIGGICLVTGATPAYIHSFRPSRTGRLATRIGWLAAGISGTAVLTELLLLGSNRLLVACFGAMVVSIAWGVGWFIVQVARHRQEMLANPGVRVTLRMCILTIFTMPLMAANDFLNLIPALQVAQGGQRLVFVPLFLAVWSVLLLRKNLGVLVDRPSPGASGPEQPPAPAIAGNGGCFDLSEREKEVLPWLVQGLSYEQIADRLCISHSTVKTHVRRIYQKMGVSGKIALISRLKELEKP